jgi:methionine biosynthesis protein MetW
MTKLLKPGGGRADLSFIADWIDRGSSVLDLGCGDGELLAHLARGKGVRGIGVEIESARALSAIRKGIPVLQRDLDEALSYFGDGSFDTAILSQTIQELRHPRDTLREILRVANRAIVSFPNFGHLPLRLQLLFHGTMPRTRALYWQWYDTPNIHLMTVRDFTSFCEEEGYRVLERHYIRGGRVIDRLPFPNLLSEGCIALVTAKN